jgi:hypothetical protein
VVVDKKTRKVVCVSFANGKKHDFRLFKESKVRAVKTVEINTDTGYQGIGKIHANSILPRKKTKKKPLSKADKAFNKAVSSKRADNENAIGFIKRFNIVSTKYRNRRKRFGLRFSLLAGEYNSICVIGITSRKSVNDFNTA